MKRIASTILAFLLALFMGISAVPAFATDTTTINPVDQLTANDGLTSALVTQLNQDLRNDSNLTVDYDILSYNYSNGQITFDAQDYHQSPLTQRRGIMKTLLTNTANSNLAPLQRTKLYNFIADRDTDVSQAMSLLQSSTSNTLQQGEAFFTPMERGIGTVLAIIIMIIMMLLLFGTVCDIAYMVAPPVRLFLDKTKSGKPHFISAEAKYAVDSSEGSGSSGWTGYMGTYLRVRAGSVAMIVLVLILIVTGKIWDPLFFLASALGF